MKRSTNRILTTHVGSLIRPPALQDFLRLKQAGKPYDETAYQKCLANSVTEVVRHQAHVGVDVISDGEFGKSISWSQYVLERLSGFERRPIRNEAANPFKRGADRTRFAEFYAELDAQDGVVTSIDAVCVGPIAIYRPSRTAARHRQLQDGAQGRAGGGGVLAGGGAGERDPRPQERILQEWRGAADRDRRGDARRIQNDRRCRLAAAARRCAQRRHLRPHGAAGHIRGLPALARQAGGHHQPRHRRAAGKTASAITSAGAHGRARMSATCR